MLQYYVDGSGTGDPDLFVMAGYVAPAEKWAEFSKEWQERLDMRPCIPYFKMNEMAQSPERIERAGWFYRVIEQHVTAAISCAFRVSDWVRAVRQSPLSRYVKNTKQLENPYFVAFNGTVNMLAHEAGKFGIREPVDFIFDNEQEKNLALKNWDRLKLAADPNARRIMGGIPTFKNDENTLPLQAADLYAWWVRKWIVEKIIDGVKDLKFPWPVQRGIPRMHEIWEEEDFKDLIARTFKSKSIAIATLVDPSQVLQGDLESFDAFWSKRT